MDRAPQAHSPCNYYKQVDFPDKMFLTDRQTIFLVGVKEQMTEIPSLPLVYEHFTVARFKYGEHGLKRINSIEQLGCRINRV